MVQICRNVQLAPECKANSPASVRKPQRAQVKGSLSFAVAPRLLISSSPSQPPPTSGWLSLKVNTYFTHAGENSREYTLGKSMRSLSVAVLIAAWYLPIRVNGAIACMKGKYFKTPNPETFHFSRLIWDAGSFPTGLNKGKCVVLVTIMLGF